MRRAFSWRLVRIPDAADSLTALGRDPGSAGSPRRRASHGARDQLWQSTVSKASSPRRPTGLSLGSEPVAISATGIVYRLAAIRRRLES